MRESRFQQRMERKQNRGCWEFRLLLRNKNVRAPAPDREPSSARSSYLCRTAIDLSSAGSSFMSAASRGRLAVRSLRISVAPRFCLRSIRS